MEHSLCDTTKRNTTETGSCVGRHDHHVKSIARDIDNHVDDVAGTYFNCDFKPGLLKPHTNLPQVIFARMNGPGIGAHRRRKPPALAPHNHFWPLLAR